MQLEKIEFQKSQLEFKKVCFHVDMLKELNGIIDKPTKTIMFEI